MTRNKALKILNPFMFLLAINQATTAIFMEQLTEQTIIFHKAGGAILLICIATHFTLNFDWVKANYLSKLLK